MSGDTIAAIATALGEGGISVIRVSGPEAIRIVANGFSGKRMLSEAPTHTAHYGVFKDQNGNEIDEVISVLYRQPNSYTGENVVEVSCHGGVFITKRVLSTIIEFGARHAEPGEFTKRAYLNGKMDLSQAEAVADLIRSRTEFSNRASMHQLQGMLSGKISALRDRLIRTLGLLELELDFVEEDIEFIKREDLIAEVNQTMVGIEDLLATYRVGKILREGLKVVLAGAPNVGKSSILNSLLGENRAIVTELPGTTRDVIEENVNLDGLLVRLVDTAGVRMTDHIVEAEGVRRSEIQVRDCNILLLVFDASRQLEEIDIEMARRLLTELKPAEAKCMLLLNKNDLPSKIEIDKIDEIEFLIELPKVSLSATTGNGMEELRRSVVNSLGMDHNRIQEGSAIVTTERHYTALIKARESSLAAKESLEKGKTTELAAVDIRAALDYLGEIIGVVTTDDILNDIFSKFCIGK